MVRLQFALENMMMVAKGKKKKKFSFLPYYLESRYLLGSRGRTGITKELTEAKHWYLISTVIKMKLS